MNFTVGQYIWIKDCINRDSYTEVCARIMEYSDLMELFNVTILSSSDLITEGNVYWVSDRYLLRLMSEQEIEDYKVGVSIKKYNL